MHLSVPVAYTVVRSKAAALSLLIQCLLLLPLWESVIVLGFVVRYFMSILVCNHLDGEERAGWLAWSVLLVSRDCCVTLPRGAMSLSAVCDCGISWYTQASRDGSFKDLLACGRILFKNLITFQQIGTSTHFLPCLTPHRSQNLANKK